MKSIRSNAPVLAIASLLAPSAVHAACQLPFNQMPNCAFPSDIAGWTNTNAAGESFGVLSHTTFQGNEALGALQFNSVFVGGAVAYRANAARCLVPAIGTDDMFGSIALKLTSGGGDVDCQLNLSRFASADCTGAVSAATQTSFGLNPSFVRFTTPPFLLGTSASVKLDITCGGNVVEDFTGLVDDVIVAEDILLADSFE